MIPTALIAIGSNLGDRAAHLRTATSALRTLPESRLVAVSPVFETAPIGPVAQGPYLNAAAALQTTLGPRALLGALLAIERAAGRERREGERWGPRTLDLDLLIYENLIVNEPGLTLPHPRLHERAFVLEPLSHIAAAAVIPGKNLTIVAALAALRSPAP
ncbi:MAG: 2-amino-4-hydroxy-6-hydroxymethyldihydropteridine diphosphokinase [Phycisphaerales bacterium]|nr:2-amino-4-hydroxy-6-hydroxymethyldihydropteridine diphosphokinase [Phycisphaerales bacterium]